MYINYLQTVYRSGSGYHYIKRLPSNWKPFSYGVVFFMRLIILSFIATKNILRK